MKQFIENVRTLQTGALDKKWHKTQTKALSNLPESLEKIKLLKVQFRQRNLF